MIKHNRPLITPEDRAAVDAVLASGWIAAGPEVEGLEADFDARYGTGGSCAVSSGTAALFLSLKALGVGPGDRVALPTYTCSALLNAIHMAQATPLLVDVCLADFNLDPAALDRVAGASGPKATLAVHTYGAPANIQAIAQVGGAVIEDCCQALGGTVGDRPLGSTGAAAVFSFYASKIITCGQGGLLRDPTGQVAEAARDYREFDCRETYVPRFNLQLTDFQAAFARTQLKRLDWIAERRREIGRRYLAALPAHLGTQAGLDAPGRMVQRFILTLPDAERRDAMQARLSAQGVQTIVPLERHELLHRYLGLDPRAFPNAERLADTTLSLPIYPALTDAEVDAVCDVLSRLEA